MNATGKPTNSDDDMPAEIDFAGGARGKFHQPDVTLNVPVYLDAEVRAYLAPIAAKKGVPLPTWRTNCSERKSRYSKR